MPDWDLFAGVAVLAAVALLALARATERALTAAPDERGEGAALPGNPTVGRGERAVVQEERAVAPEARPGDAEPRPLRSPAGSTTGLLVNVALSQGLFGAALVAVAWYAQIPPAALGLAFDAGDATTGVALGLGLFVAAEIAERLAERLGYGTDDRLRALLAPETPVGWAVLLVLVLPAVAGVEELLFRGALVGALAAGYGLPVWGLAVASSVAFGLGHGLQGPGGVVVTGVLGFALAAAFVLTGSLWTVLVAHYLLNALEFVAHEGSL